MNGNVELKMWVESYADELYRKALFLTSHRETSEDMVQETFLAASQNIHQFEGKSSPRTWLHAILKNKVADHFRERYKLTNHDSSLESFEDQFFTKEGSWKPEAAPNPWGESEKHLLDDPDFSKVLQVCLDHLPQQWRDIVVLKFLEERKGEDISTYLGISTANYWQIMHRAKLQLRGCIEKGWFH